MDTQRICHVLNWGGSGGGAIQAKTLLDGWNDHPDLEAWAIHAANLGAPESFVTEEPGYPLMYPAEFTDGMREIDPDLVFVHGFSPDLDNKLRGLAESDDFDAKFVLRKGMNLFEQWAGGGSAENIVHQVTKFSWYDAIVCPTQAVAERLRLCYGRDVPTLAYVSNAIRREDYVPSSFMTDGFLKVVTASRGAPNNYLLSPLLAVARIIESAEFPIKLDMFGANSGPHSDTLHSLTDGFDDIQVHGRVDHDSLRDHLEAADVVCVPSISHQAIPLVALEGMASGNIVLGSFPEAEEEDAIITVPATHPPSWKEALTDAYEDPEDAREWVRKGIEKSAFYDVSTVVEDGYVPVFEEIIDG